MLSYMPRGTTNDNPLLKPLAETHCALHVQGWYSLAQLPLAATCCPGSWGWLICTSSASRVALLAGCGVRLLLVLVERPAQQQRWPARGLIWQIREQHGSAKLANCCIGGGGGAGMPHAPMLLADHTPYKLSVK